MKCSGKVAGCYANSTLLLWAPRKGRKGNEKKIPGESCGATIISSALQSPFGKGGRMKGSRYYNISTIGHPPRVTIIYPTEKITIHLIKIYTAHILRK